jgi:hypothetical protein
MVIVSTKSEDSLDDRSNTVISGMTTSLPKADQIREKLIPEIEAIACSRGHHITKIMRVGIDPRAGARSSAPKVSSAMIAL